MVLEILILALLGGLFELDRTAAIQSLASEPIVIGPTVGLVVGEPMLGLQVGVLLQLFFLGSVSIGGSTPPDGAMAALVAAGSAGVMGGAARDVSTEALVAMSSLLFMAPASRLGGWVDKWIKESNVALAHIADDRALKEGAGAIEKIVHKRLVQNFALWTGVSALCLVLGASVLWYLFSVMPEDVFRALEGSGRLLPLVAAGVALSALKLKRANWWFAGACVILLVISAQLG